MKKIKLTRRKWALVDDEDYDWLSQFKWWAQFDGYNWYAAGRPIKLPKRRIVQMHRFIMGIQISGKIDHKDHDGLNNQKHNLRQCTQSQNQCNKKFSRNNTTGFKGVTFRKQRKITAWIAQIRAENRVIHLGSFRTASEAANAYDAAAQIHFGEFACTNSSLGLLK